MKRFPYEVWMTQGQGGFPIAGFSSFLDASKYHEDRIISEEGSFALVDTAIPDEQFEW